MRGWLGRTAVAKPFARSLAVALRTYRSSVKQLESPAAVAELLAVKPFDKISRGRAEAPSDWEYRLTKDGKKVLSAG